MIQQSTATLIVAGMGFVGTLGGIFTGHLLSRSWQHQQWILDCRKEEFRELIKGLGDEIIDLMVYYGARNAKSSVAQTYAQKVLDSHLAVTHVMANRMYIAINLWDRNIPNRYAEIMGDARSTDFGDDAQKQIAELMEEVIELATKR